MKKTIESLVAHIAKTKTTKQLATVFNEKSDAVIQIKGFTDHTDARMFATNLITILRKQQWKIHDEKHTLGDPKSESKKTNTDLSVYNLRHPTKGEIHIAFSGHPQPGYLTRITLKNTQITE